MYETNFFEGRNVLIYSVPPDSFEGSRVFRVWFESYDDYSDCQAFSILFYSKSYLCSCVSRFLLDNDLPDMLPDVFGSPPDVSYLDKVIHIFEIPFLTSFQCFVDGGFYIFSHRLDIHTTPLDLIPFIDSALSFFDDDFSDRGSSYV